MLVIRDRENILKAIKSSIKSFEIRILLENELINLCIQLTVEIEKSISSNH